MMMMMQEKFYDENNRSLNYTKIDRCQDNISIDNDEYYRQILHLNEHLHSKQQDIKIKIILTHQFHFILFVLLILTSQSNALPIYQSLQTQINYNQQGGASYSQQSPSSLPIAMVQLTDRIVYPQQTYKVYQRFTNSKQQQLNNIPSYSNSAAVQIYDQTNFNNQQQQQQQLSEFVQNPNEQQLTLQLRRERQRRTMIDRMVVLFDEDGNGQLTKDELYSMALRSNMFPKFHHYLKQTTA